MASEAAAKDGFIGLAKQELDASRSKPPFIALAQLRFIGTIDSALSQFTVGSRLSADDMTVVKDLLGQIAYRLNETQGTRQMVEEAARRYLQASEERV